MRLALWMFAFVAAVPARAAVDADDAGLVTEMVTAALAKEALFDVVASGDVRRQLDVEANKQSLGCAESASCLADVAGALGAQLVVYGKLGQLDDVVILTLNLFDSCPSPRSLPGSWASVQSSLP